MINMGNREEIIKGKTYLSLIKGEQKIILIHDDVINAMQEYSDQQNKQLLEEIDELKSKVSNWMDKYTEVNEENKKLQSELKDKERVNEQQSKKIIEIINDSKLDKDAIIKVIVSYLTNQNK